MTLLLCKCCKDQWEINTLGWTGKKLIGEYHILFTWKCTNCGTINIEYIKKYLMDLNNIEEETEF